jgi:SanA protein
MDDVRSFSKRRRYTIMGFMLLLAVLSLFWIANKAIEDAIQGRIFSTAESIEKHKVGLLLGTSKLLKDGRTNLYFQYRIDAAVELFENGKIEHVLISGDHGINTYNEPLDMKNELMQRGIPESNIHLDYAGFRTLDSVVRAKEIFGQSSFIVISQRFHNERAVYLAIQNDIDAIGFNARDVDRIMGFKTNSREKLARVKAYLDILFRVRPKFLGERVAIQ